MTVAGPHMIKLVEPKARLLLGRITVLDDAQARTVHGFAKVNNGLDALLIAPPHGSLPIRKLVGLVTEEVLQSKGSCPSRQNS